jgi:hypothetical protein
MFGGNTNVDSHSIGGAVLFPNVKEEQTDTSRKDGHAFQILPQKCITMTAANFLDAWPIFNNRSK